MSSKPFNIRIGAADAILLTQTQREELLNATKKKFRELTDLEPRVIEFGREVEGCGDPHCLVCGEFTGR